MWCRERGKLMHKPPLEVSFTYMDYQFHLGSRFEAPPSVPRNCYYLTPLPTFFRLGCDVNSLYNCVEPLPVGKNVKCSVPESQICKNLPWTQNRVNEWENYNYYTLVVVFLGINIQNCMFLF